jgi:hypothetical protein
MNTTDSAPAGGAALGEVLAATGGALLATAILFYLGWGHRTGRTDLLRRVSALAARDTGFAAWAALPSLLAAGSLIVALLGMYWDVSLHIDQGRDAGPLANPADYLILFGLFGIFAAGFVAIVLPEGKPSPRAVRIAGDWYAPLGGIAMLAAAAFALIGFPLDDVWHRIFGQDVTLWGPTHLMLIAGAGLTLIGSAILIVEGRGDRPPRGARPAGRRDAGPGGAIGLVARYRRAFAVGGLLIGLSTFQAEFDFGVPQFQLVLEPIMLAFAAGTALVAARIWIGPGAALGAALFFIALRGLVALIVGPVLGETTPHLPLYLAEALCVEGLALVLSTRRTYSFGAIAGALVGSVGFFAEYAWSHLWMPVPWPQSLISEAIAPVLIAGIAAGILGAFLGGALAAAGERGSDRSPAGAGRRARGPALVPAALASAAIGAAVGLNVGDEAPRGWSAHVSLDEVAPEPQRTVAATVRLDPPQVADDAYWLSAIAWQGGGLDVDRLERVSEGVYRTTEPLPVHGTWKTLIRLQRDNYVAGLPIYLPRDSAIPAEAVPARASFTRPFVDETEILQRELKPDVPGYLAGVAYSVVAAIVLGILLLLGWLLTRIASGPDEGRRRRGRSRSEAGAAAAARGARVRPPMPGSAAR